MDHEALRQFVRTLATGPGVYRMLDEGGAVLYVGKARNLQKRVSSYFRGSGLATRTQLLMQQVHVIEVSRTHTENEALILENNLIKNLKPRFNILLRDDKSYPYIYLSAEDFPRLAFHRGARNARGQYFGPFPSAASVRESLNLLQKVFPVRQCEDSVFRNRSRPCLQYQIKRCSAPCVGYITPAAYEEDVRHAAMFLQGRSPAIIEEMVERMDRAAATQDYENAARYRDRIAALRRVQERQYVAGEGGDADVLAVAQERGEACISVSFIRGGRNLGNRNFFVRVGAEEAESAILSAFLPQYYLEQGAPPTLYLSHAIADRDLLQSAFTRDGTRRITIQERPRGRRRGWVRLALLNAQDALRQRLLGRLTLERRFEALQQALALAAVPERIECFDVSHTQGEATVASCVVFTAEGPLKSDYRRYNIREVTPGDDYGAMTQALSRRFRRADEEERVTTLPDVLLIDGGRGQLAVAEEVLGELGISEVQLVGVAKGVERKPGMERLFLPGVGEPLILGSDSAALHLIQQVRDEAHRFAISGHRARRAKARMQSPLEEIPGIGDKRRQMLLRHLGGLQEVARAGVEELERVPGISPELARKIYETFRQGEA